MKKKHLTESEVEAFLKAAKKTCHPERDYAMALMTFRHGLRVSELCDLRLDQLDLTTGRIEIRRLKKGLDTTHPMQGDEVRAIKAWLRKRQASKFADSEFLFLSDQGPMTRHAVSYLCRAIAKIAALPPVNPHMLRHSCGFALGDRNIATHTIADYLGHKDLNSAIVYIAANPKRFINLWRKPHN